MYNMYDISVYEIKNIFNTLNVLQNRLYFLFKLLLFFNYEIKLANNFRISITMNWNIMKFKLVTKLKEYNWIKGEY